MKKQTITTKLIVGISIIAGCLALALGAKAIWVARADAKSLHGNHDKEIAIWFAPDKTEVCLHPARNSGTANVKFEILDNADKVIAAAQKSVDLGKEPHVTTTMQLAVGKLGEETRSQFRWNRLRYTLTIDNETETKIVQLTDAMPNQFTLGVTAPEHLEPGMSYRIVSHAQSLENGGPVAGVRVHATLIGETDPKIEGRPVLTES